MTSIDELGLELRRRDLMKYGTVAAGGTIAGAAFTGWAAAHEGGVALLGDPGSWRLFHVLSDTGDSFALTPTCTDDGEYDHYKIQFWTRRMGGGYTKRGQRDFLVPADRRLIVTGDVVPGPNGTVAQDDDFDRRDLHELHNGQRCQVNQGPLRFQNAIRANFRPVGGGG